MDYVPPKRDARYQWYKNLSDHIVAEAVKMGAASGDATAIKAIADDIIAKYDATNAAQTTLDGVRLAIRHQPREKGVEIAAHIGVGVFLNEQRGGGVAQMEGDEAVAKIIFGNPLFHRAGKF